jgi:hypothetical protein
MNIPLILLSSLVVTLAGASPAAAQGSAKSPPEGNADLALQLSNPVASLISVPFQKNVDFGLGADGSGWQSRTNIQPVIPISIAKDWNMISRTILPVIVQEGVTAPRTDQLGLGDVVQSLFFSPKAPGPGGIIWGAGPVFLLPTGTNAALGAQKWGAGPTAVALRQSGPWTVGMLANHIWSFAGAEARQDVSATFMQPFITYTTPKATTIAFNTETTYDWKNDRWLVPLNLTVNQVIPLGGQLVQVGVGGRYYVESPAGGPDWGMRFSFTFLFPKR